MLTLASMIWAAFLFVQTELHIKGLVPPPVVIEKIEGGYSYDNIYSAIYVPDHWTDSCYNQQQIVLYMGEHYNNFRNGNQKVSHDKLIEISKKWVCIQ